jgi:Eisosome protein 1
MIAKDYKAPPQWQPGQNANCTKAAIIAARAGGKYEAWKPEASAWGSSAANQAFKLDRSGRLSPQIESRDLTGLGRQNSLVAATGAMAGHRRRSDSTPIPRPTYPDESNAVVNALSAATYANKPSEKLKPAPLPEPVTTPFIKMPREMFTSHPPISLESDERNKADSLRASAIAMAKQMYSVQKRQIEEASKASGNDVKSATSSPYSHLPSASTTDNETMPMQLNSLQDAAQRLAQERLAKLHSENVQSRAYRDYYGSSPRQKSKLSIRGRRRACSESSLNDKEQSEKIRAQMSLFSSSLSQVDSKRQQLDREALMAIAQRNVTASLHGMDQRVLKDTGKIPPSMLNEWGVKAHTAAQKNSESRMANYGKINIGGGNFIDQSMVNQVAARNVQPVLDEINDKAEQERVRQAEHRLEQQAYKRLAEAKKALDKETKEADRKLKGNSPRLDCS